MTIRSRSVNGEHGLGVLGAISGSHATGHAERVNGSFADLISEFCSGDNDGELYPTRHNDFLLDGMCGCRECDVDHALRRGLQPRVEAPQSPLASGITKPVGAGGDHALSRLPGWLKTRA